MIRYLFYVFISMFLLSCDRNNGYRVEKAKVVFEWPWNAGHGTDIDDVDADVGTFQLLGNSKSIWAKDKYKLFFKGMTVDSINPQFFVLLNEEYGKDDKTVICRMKPILEADVTTFRVKEFRDDAGKKVVLGLDKNAAYTCSENGYRHLVSNSIDNFRPIKHSFYKDSENVWWNSIQMPDANPDSFKVLSGGYATDGGAVYYRGKEVTGADASTFKVTSDYHAKDKNYKYEFEDRVE